MGWRKFSLVVMVLVSAMILALMKVIDGGQITMLLSIALGVYPASNVAEHALKKGGK